MGSLPLSLSLICRVKSRTAFHSTPSNSTAIATQPRDSLSGVRLGFVQLRAEVSNNDGNDFQGAFSRERAALRCPLSCSLKIPEINWRSTSILTTQSRIPAGSLDLLSCLRACWMTAGQLRGLKHNRLKKTGIDI